MTPDITMCDRKDCPSSQLCYRFTATPNPYRQAYFAEPYPAIVGDRCDYFTGNLVYEAQKAEAQLKETMRAAFNATRVPEELLGDRKVKSD